MANEHSHRNLKQSDQDRARIKALRERFQAERPSLDELVHKHGYEDPVSHGTYLESKLIAHMLKDARKRANMSLAEASIASGMDRAAISRLENAVYANVTINTLNRLASAYGKHFTFRLENMPATADG